MVGGMKLRPIKWVLSPTDDHMLSMECTDIEIVDEGGGEYVEVSQSADGHGKISINPEEWPMMRQAIDDAIKQCRDLKP
jgi:hypothetical protein